MKTLLANNTKLPLILAVGITLFAFLFVAWQANATSNVQDQMILGELLLERNGRAAQLSEYKQTTKPTKREVKGIYLTAYSVGIPSKMDTMITLLNTTELNAVVVDIKDYSGKVLYDSNVALVNEFYLEDVRIPDVKAIYG